MKNLKMAMKALLVLSVIMLMASAVFAESAKVSWKQALADQPSLKEWIIYSGDSAATVTELTRIPYTGQSGNAFVSTVPVTITGTPGARVQKYFALAAVSKNNNVTARVPGQTAAGVGYLEFTVPYGEVSAPFEVLIEIVVGP